jgi:3-deoxy-7-phosphoheptulonate synthase
MTTRKPYQLVSREWKNDSTVINIDGIEIGGKHKVLMAGPCAIESEEQIHTISEYLSKQGITFLRGGAYKPRTSPYSFQGLKEEGLKYIRAAADSHNMKVVTEVLSSSLVDEVCEYADVLQIGTRNMQNYQLLKAVSKIDKPVLLKRGMSSTIEEWLLAAEYILLGGNQKVILCERGVRTFENMTRNTLDLAAIPLVKELSHLPVIVDPSQGTGVRNIVVPMSTAAIAAGADGLIVEVHNQPSEAMSDGDQSLYFDQFELLKENFRQQSKLQDKLPDFDRVEKSQFV